MNFDVSYATLLVNKSYLFCPSQFYYGLFWESKTNTIISQRRLELRPIYEEALTYEMLLKSLQRSYAMLNCHSLQNLQGILHF